MSLFPLVGLPSTSLLIYPLSYLHPKLTIRSGRAAASTDPAAEAQLHSREVHFRAGTILTSASLPARREPHAARAKAISSYRQLCLS